MNDVELRNYVLTQDIDSVINGIRPVVENISRTKDEQNEGFQVVLEVLCSNKLFDLEHDAWMGYLVERINSRIHYHRQKSPIVRVPRQKWRAGYRIQTVTWEDVHNDIHSTEDKLKQMHEHLHSLTTDELDHRIIEERILGKNDEEIAQIVGLTTAAVNWRRNRMWRKYRESLD
jgi:hypothetical protein